MGFFEPGGNYTGGFHTFAVDWERGSITWYYDGHQVWKDTSGIAGAPMYLILGLGVGSPPSRPPPSRSRTCGSGSTSRGGQQEAGASVR